ncbi:MAG: hypothetical protein PHC88_02965 [Terrimicrobiaceae bacterium]|nr:hypothetical protein [Terrimicrobiaceae bacterium]
MMPVLLATAVLLPLLLALGRTGLRWPDAVPAALAWAWALLVLVANVLSPAGELRNHIAYAALLVAFSIGAAFCIGWLSRRRRVEDVEGLLRVPPAEEAHSPWARALFAASVTFLCLGFAWNLLVALTIEPVNPDTLMYRLPRVWWYLGQGNLRHFAESVDPRVVFYPFNVSLVCLPFALFGVAPVVFNLPSVTAWTVVAITTFQMVRWMGCGRHLAAFVAFLIAFAPIVFVEATSTNDEIIAGAGVLTGIYFGLRYLREGSRLDLSTAALALGCGLGSKLHFYFFWPVLPLLGVWLLIAAARHPAVRSYALNPARLRDLAVALVVIVALSTPFLIYNRLSSPKFAYSGDEARNSPFSIRVAEQTLSLLTAQLFLSAIPTFEDSPKAAVRQRPIDEWNAWWNAQVFRSVDQSPAFTYVTYRFRGVTNPMAGLHFENTEWAGLLPWLFVACGVVLAAARAPRDWFAAALAITLLVWWVTYGATMKYFDTVGVYFAYPVIICGSFIAAGLRPGRSRAGTWSIWALAGVVAVGHLALCRNILLFGYDRSLSKVVRAIVAGKPIDSSSPRLGLGKALAGLERVTLVAAHWAVPYYEIMKAAPLVAYHLKSNSISAIGPVVTAIEANPAFDGFLPVKVAVPPGRGLVYLDTILCSYGPELVFGDAPSFGMRMPRARSRYLVFKASVDETNPAARTLRISPLVLGAAGLEGAVCFRYAVIEPGKADATADWSSSAGREFPIAGTPAEKLQLRIEVADANGRQMGAGAFTPFAPPGLKEYHAVEP